MGADLGPGVVNSPIQGAIGSSPAATGPGPRQAAQYGPGRQQPSGPSQATTGPGQVAAYTGPRQPQALP